MIPAIGVKNDSFLSVSALCVLSVTVSKNEIFMIKKNKKKKHKRLGGSSVIHI